MKSALNKEGLRTASGHNTSSSGDGQHSESFTSALDKLVREYQVCARENPNMAVATVAIESLTKLIIQSQATTFMGLEKEIKEAAAALQRCNPSSISLKAGCELFLRYTTRTSAIENEDFKVAKARLIEIMYDHCTRQKRKSQDHAGRESLSCSQPAASQISWSSKVGPDRTRVTCTSIGLDVELERGNQFAETSSRARQTIADLGARFISNGHTVLVHGYSRVVLAIIQRAAAQGSHFTVMVVEGRPTESGLRMAKALASSNIPTSIVMDSGVAYCMDKIDMVLVGAEAVVESGGIINKLGTYQIALCARALNRPFYVAAESYKFARLFPLHQRDLQHDSAHLTDILPFLPQGVKVENLSRDYTPPDCISLLITNIGVLTPAAVSDELIQLYI